MATAERAKTEHVMSSREFREVLKKEIHRSDRTLVSLTFLIFDVVLKPRRGARHEEALKYAKERTQFGKYLSQFQYLQFMLADMATELELAKNLLYKVVNLHCHSNYLFLEKR